MNVLITGCNGTIGGYFFSELKKKNFNVIGLNRKFENKNDDIYKSNYSLNNLENIIEKNKINIVLHFAAQTSQSLSDLRFKKNNIITQTLLQACEKKGVQLFCLFSSDLANSKWGFYGYSKFKDEKFTKESIISKKIIFRVAPVIKLNGNNSNSSIGKIFQNIIDEKLLFLPCPKEIFIKPIFIDEIFISSLNYINDVLIGRKNTTFLKTLNGSKQNFYSMISKFANKNSKKLRIITIPRYFLIFVISISSFFQFKILQIESIRNLLINSKK